jgi:hypothetical protein
MKAKAIGLTMLAGIVAVAVSSCTADGMTTLEEGVSGVLVELADFVKEVSPIVWETMVRQAYVIGIRNVIIGLVLFVLTGALIKAGHGFYLKHQAGTIWNKERDWRDDKPEYSGDEGAIVWVVAMCVVITGVLGSVALFSGFTTLANPNYEAIKILLQFV